MKGNADINELSEILLLELAKRPELVAKIKALKGAAEPDSAAAVTPGRMGMRQRIEMVRKRYHHLGSIHNSK